MKVRWWSVAIQAAEVTDGGGTGGSCD
ncbi:unnamed protein product [Spirodela intermedia]|uniref:Uncharacterized protein n=2 Tax=Spirodela intermedia TaxID=51605 RepID=A0A7I8LIY7_SPIIN|nr:unnamed protein product [Spirodela intermedia]CAA6672768.1 unnamed protein product [Spirodela intermedia]CAA7409997.1 unnamed protein product [Spirodela intermedia]